MGTTAAPVAGSGSWPTWMAAVSKRIDAVISNSMVRLVGRSDSRSTGYIAVAGQWRRSTGGGKVPFSYVHSLRLAGCTPKVLSTFEMDPYEAPLGVDVGYGFEPDDASALDGAVGLVLPGGGDIDPSWYGQPQHALTTAINHRRDTFELTLLKEALRRDLPVLA